MISTVFTNRAHEPLTLAAIRANPRAHAWALRCGRGLAESLHQHDPAALEELGTLEAIEAELARITAQLSAAPAPASRTTRAAPAATAAAAGPAIPPLRLEDVEAGRACSWSFLADPKNAAAFAVLLLTDDAAARTAFGDDAAALAHYLGALARGTVRPRGKGTVFSQPVTVRTAS